MDAFIDIETDEDIKYKERKQNRCPLCITTRSSITNTASAYRPSTTTN
jgi:hypothetical protein